VAAAFPEAVKTMETVVQAVVINYLCLIGFPTFKLLRKKNNLKPLKFDSKAVEKSFSSTKTTCI
jgi:hypothetical protein